MQTFLVPKKFVFRVTSAWTANGVWSLTFCKRQQQGRKKQNKTELYYCLKGSYFNQQKQTNLSYHCPMTYLLTSSSQCMDCDYHIQANLEVPSPLKYTVQHFASILTYFGRGWVRGAIESKRDPESRILPPKMQKFDYSSGIKIQNQGRQMLPYPDPFLAMSFWVLRQDLGVRAVQNCNKHCKTFCKG